MVMAGKVRETGMRRLGHAIALFARLVCPTLADTALPGLVQENLLLPITLANGSEVKLEAIVIRPMRFPLIVLVHRTPRATDEGLRTRDGSTVTG